MKPIYFNDMQIAERATAVMLPHQSEIDTSLKIRFDGENIMVVNGLGEVVTSIKANANHRTIVQKMPFHYYSDLDMDDEDYDISFDEYCDDPTVPFIVYLNDCLFVVNMEN